MGRGENINEKCSLVLCSAQTQDGLHHLVSIQLYAQGTRDAGCGAVGATAEETYQIMCSKSLKEIYLHLLQAQRPCSKQASLHSTLDSSVA